MEVSLGFNRFTHYIRIYKKDAKRIDLFISIARNASSSENKILASDIVSALCLLDTEYIDFQDLFITDAHFSYLSFEGKEINRLSISNSCIERINLTNSKFTDQVQIRDCIISTIYGISSIESVPSQIIDCDIDNYEALATTTLIKRANLSLSQKLLVDMLQKFSSNPEPVGKKRLYYEAWVFPLINLSVNVFFENSWMKTLLLGIKVMKGIFIKLNVAKPDGLKNHD